MPKLKHLAIRTEDTGKLATFYMDVFDMQILHKDKKEGGVIYLTDGYFNLAILPNHEQNAPNGLYHFGFEVENGEKIVEHEGTRRESGYIGLQNHDNRSTVKFRNIRITTLN